MQGNSKIWHSKVPNEKLTTFLTRESKLMNFSYRNGEVGTKARREGEPEVEKWVG